MTTPSASHWAAQTLTFKKHLIRIVTVDRVPWFALEDINDALGFPASHAARAFSTDFPAHARMECLEDTDEGQKDATILSPVGVWYFTMATDRYRGPALQSWAKKNDPKRVVWGKGVAVR